MKKEFKVIKVKNDNEIVISGGSDSGIVEGSTFLVYKKGEEMFDPDTKKSLGFLEIVCGKAKVKHLQGTLTTLESCKRETTITTRVITREHSYIYNGSKEEIKEPNTRIVPFDDVDEKGDCFARVLKTE